MNVSIVPIAAHYFCLRDSVVKPKSYLSRPMMVRCVGSTFFISAQNCFCTEKPRGHALLVHSHVAKVLKVEKSTRDPVAFSCETVSLPRLAWLDVCRLVSSRKNVSLYL